VSRGRIAGAFGVVVVLASGCAGQGGRPDAGSPTAATASTAAPTGVAPGAAAASVATAAVPAVPPVPPIVGTTWHWFRTLDPERSWEAPDPTRFTLTLGADGRALVRADCNRGAGSYALQDGRLELEAIATTKMACPTANGLDARFLAQLDAVRLVVVSAGMLRADLLADGGTMFFVAEPDAKFGAYRCEGDRRAWAVYTEARARVVTGPDTHDLPLAVSASGARYAQGDVVWWVKGDEAFLEKGGVRTLSGCTRTPPAA
jgi:heat shock protein HslJ